MKKELLSAGGACNKSHSGNPMLRQAKLLRLGRRLVFGFGGRGGFCVALLGVRRGGRRLLIFGGAFFIRFATIVRLIEPGPLKHNRRTGTDQPLELRLATFGTFAFDRRTHSLIVVADSAWHTRVRDVIAVIDQPAER